MDRTSTQLIDGDSLADRLGHALAVSRPACVVIAEVTGLDVVDALAGRVTHDRVITAIGQRLTESVRADDLVAHLGGGSFAVVCFGITDPALGSVVAERVRGLLGGRVVAAGQMVTLSATAGAAVADGSLEAVAAEIAAGLLVSRARRALNPAPCRRTVRVRRRAPR